MPREILGNSSKVLMNLSRNLIDDARVLFMTAPHVKDPDEKLRMVRRAAEILAEAARIRNQAIEEQIAEIRKAKKTFDFRLPPNLRLF